MNTLVYVLTGVDYDCTPTALCLCSLCSNRPCHQEVRVVADQDYLAGDTVTISYGLKSSAECLEDHGIVPDLSPEESSCEVQTLNSISPTRAPVYISLSHGWRKAGGFLVCVSICVGAPVLSMTRTALSWEYWLSYKFILFRGTVISRHSRYFHILMTVTVTLDAGVHSIRCLSD